MSYPSENSTKIQQVLTLISQLHDEVTCTINDPTLVNMVRVLDFPM